MWVLGRGCFAKPSRSHLHHATRRNKVDTYDMSACNSAQVSLSILRASNSLDDTLPSIDASCNSTRLRSNISMFQVLDAR